MKKTELRSHSREFSFFLNILNEACYGIPITDYENILGVNRNEVLQLMEKFQEIEKLSESSLILNENELFILNKAFKETYKEIEKWEFQTRIGFSIDEAANMIKNLE